MADFFLKVADKMVSILDEGREFFNNRFKGFIHQSINEAVVAGNNYMTQDTRFAIFW